MPRRKKAATPVCKLGRVELNENGRIRENLQVFVQKQEKIKAEFFGFSAKINFA